mmetsp:Transcript_34443/g.76536  ORF Transcript_34443/g.76536 Transcript_34443/m.76536 type:complete len:249 (+) Transcript_34443:545-1291(+)
MGPTLGLSSTWVMMPRQKGQEPGALAICSHSRLVHDRHMLWLQGRRQATGAASKQMPQLKSHEERVLTLPSGDLSPDRDCTMAAPAAALAKLVAAADAAFAVKRPPNGGPSRASGGGGTGRVGKAWQLLLLGARFKTCLCCRACCCCAASAASSATMSRCRRASAARTCREGTASSLEGSTSAPIPSMKRRLNAGCRSCVSCTYSRRAATSYGICPRALRPRRASLNVSSPQEGDAWGSCWLAGWACP